ncbi:hypothetical protein [Pseudomonas sp. OTU5201]|uniref:hypothetical protein n=1 Tax=Pseudomonas sp. OTU5201 TaxID=3043850 RepID=UPI00313B7815
MGCRGILLLVLVTPCALGDGYSDSYYGLGPYLGTTDYPSRPLQPHVSQPPRPFADLPPQPFVVIPEYHPFRDARLPRVSTEEPQVLIRTFDPALGVYRDVEIRDGEGVLDEEACEDWWCSEE